MDEISLQNASTGKIILGLDPGRDKCGVAVMNDRSLIICHQVVDSDKAIAKIVQLIRQHDVNSIVIGDGTTSKIWQQQINSAIPSMTITVVNEANSTLEARERYWTMYPPTKLQRLIPRSLLVPPRPVDDIVAILLIERYLALN